MNYKISRIGEYLKQNVNNRDEIDRENTHYGLSDLIDYLYLKLKTGETELNGKYIEITNFQSKCLSHFFSTIHIKVIEDYTAYYDARSGLIGIGKKLINDRAVLEHEVFHALLLKTVNSPSNQGIKKRLHSLFLLVKQIVFLSNTGKNIKKLIRTNEKISDSELIAIRSIFNHNEVENQFQEFLSCILTPNLCFKSDNSIIAIKDSLCHFLSKINRFDTKCEVVKGSVFYCCYENLQSHINKFDGSLAEEAVALITTLIYDEKNIPNYSPYKLFIPTIDLKYNSLSKIEVAAQKIGINVETILEHYHDCIPFKIVKSPEGQDIFAPDQFYEIAITLVKAIGINLQNQNIYEFVKSIPFKEFRNAFIVNKNDPQNQINLKLSLLATIASENEQNKEGSLPGFLVLDRIVKEFYFRLKCVSRKPIVRIEERSGTFSVTEHGDSFKNTEGYYQTNLTNDIILEDYADQLKNLMGDFEIVFVDAIQKMATNETVGFHEIDADKLAEDLYEKGYLFKGSYADRNTKILFKIKDKVKFLENINKYYDYYLNEVAKIAATKFGDVNLATNFKKSFDIREGMPEGKFVATVARIIEEELKYHSSIKKDSNGEFTGSPVAWDMNAASAFKRYVMGSLKNPGEFTKLELNKLKNPPAYKIQYLRDKTRFIPITSLTSLPDLYARLASIEDYATTSIEFTGLNDLQKIALMDIIYDKPVSIWASKEDLADFEKFKDEYHFNKLPLIGETKKDAFFEQNGEVFQRTLIFDASTLSEDQKKMFFNEYGIFRFDGATLGILGQYDKILRTYFGVSNQGQFKTFGYQDGIYLKHADHFISPGGQIAQLMQQYGIGRITFVENEKNNTAKREGLVTDFNDFFNGKVDNFKVINWNLKNTHRIKEGDNYKDEIKGNAQAAHAIAITEQNTAITSAIQDFYLDVALKNAEMLNKLTKEDIDKFITQLVFRVIQKPTNLTEKIFSVIFNDLDKKTMSNAEVAGRLREMAHFPVVKDVLKHYMNGVLKDRVKYTMEGFAPVLTPDMGNLSMDRIFYMKDKIRDYAFEILKKENPGKVSYQGDEIKERADQIWDQYFDKNGFLKINDGKMGIIISQNNARDMKLSLGDSISTYFIPLDSVTGINGFTVIGILPDNLMPRNSLIMNSEYTQFIGRDFDIDNMYINVKPKWMNTEVWDKVTDDMSQAWKKYIVTAYKAMADELNIKLENPLENTFEYKVKFLMDPDNKYEFMASFLGATNEQRMLRNGESGKTEKTDSIKNITLFSPDILKTSTKFHKDIGFLIQYREIRQLFTQGEAYAPQYGIDYRPETLQNPKMKLLWDKADLALNIATNNNVDYPKDNTKDFYNSDPINILSKTILNISHAKDKASKLNTRIAKETDDLFPFNKIFSIVRYRKGFNEFSKATTALTRLKDSKEMIEDPNKAYGIEWNIDKFMKHPLIAFINEVDTKVLEARIKEFMVSYRTNDEAAYNAFLEYQVIKQFLEEEYNYPVDTLEKIIELYSKKAFFPEIKDDLEKKQEINKEIKELLKELDVYYKNNRYAMSYSRYVQVLIEDKMRDYKSYIDNLRQKAETDIFKFRKEQGIPQGPITKNLVFVQDIVENVIRELMIPMGYSNYEQKAMYDIAGMTKDELKIRETVNSIYSLFKVDTAVSKIPDSLGRIIVHYIANQMNPSVKRDGVILGNKDASFGVDPVNRRWIYTKGETTIYVPYGQLKVGSEVEKFIMDPTTEIITQRLQSILDLTERNINAEKKTKIAIDYLNSMKNQFEDPPKAIRYILIRFLGLNVQRPVGEYNQGVDSWNRLLVHRSAWYNQPLMAIASIVQPSFIKDYIRHTQKVALETQVNFKLNRKDIGGESRLSYNTKYFLPSLSIEDAKKEAEELEARLNVNKK
ncbi:MAG: hypothetical protein L6Q59_13255 [Ignavibacteriaceae bacterium]|nr:hypothetical protein [Ignavibacteriaceae bacterium]